MNSKELTMADKLLKTMGILEWTREERVKEFTNAIRAWKKIPDSEDGKAEIFSLVMDKYTDVLGIVWDDEVDGYVLDGKPIMDL